jgi:hypothetical protein
VLNTAEGVPTENAMQIGMVIQLEYYDAPTSDQADHLRLLESLSSKGSYVRVKTLLRYRYTGRVGHCGVNASTAEGDFRTPTISRSQVRRPQGA